MKTKVESFNVWKTATIGGLVTAATVDSISCIFVPVILLILFHPGPHGEQPPNTLKLILAFQMVAVAYGVFGFLIMALWCWLYNIIAPRVGEIQIADSN